MVLWFCILGSCRNFEYRCSNDRCIDDSVNCNGLNPCGDFSDCHLSGAAIAGIVTGSVFVTCVCLTLVLVWLRNKRGPPKIRVSVEVFFFFFRLNGSSLNRWMRLEFTSVAWSHDNGPVILGRSSGPTTPTTPLELKVLCESGYPRMRTRRTWGSVWVCSPCGPYEINLLRCAWSNAYRRFTGSLCVLAMGSQEPVHVPYGFRNVHLREPYGPMRMPYGPLRMP